MKISRRSFLGSVLAFMLRPRMPEPKPKDTGWHHFAFVWDEGSKYYLDGERCEPEDWAELVGITASRGSPGWFVEGEEEPNPLLGTWDTAFYLPTWTKWDALDDTPWTTPDYVVSGPHPGNEEGYEAWRKEAESWPAIDDLPEGEYTFDSSVLEPLPNEDEFTLTPNLAWRGGERGEDGEWATTSWSIVWWYKEDK